MTGIVNLMASDIWTDADITRRTEAIVRSQFSAEAETILNRKVVAMSVGEYEPTASDIEEISRFRDVVDEAQALGAAARADMALLNQVLVMEEANRRLARPLPPDDATASVVSLDADERAKARSVIDSANEPAGRLFALRNPAGRLAALT